MGLCFTTKKKNKETSNWRTTKSSYYWTITGFYGRLFTFHLLFSTLAELKTSLIIERSENMKQNTNVNLLTVKATGACTWGPIWVRRLRYSREPLRTNKGCCQSPISWLLFGKGEKKSPTYRLSIFMFTTTTNKPGHAPITLSTHSWCLGSKFWATLRYSF